MFKQKGLQNRARGDTSLLNASTLHQQGGHNSGGAGDTSGVWSFFECLSVLPCPSQCWF